MKNQEVCPHCKGNLEQDFQSKFIDINNMVIGGSHTSKPESLDGCHCTKCGTKFIFNKRGKCPICKGKGVYQYITSRGGIKQSSDSGTCPTCQVKGTI